MIASDAVRLCAAIYDPTTLPWDRFWDAGGPDGICVGQNGSTLVFRGSVTPEDWFRDLKGNPIEDQVLGGVETGFMEGMHEFYAEIVDGLSQNPIVCGHSLGAARALLFGALLTANHRPPAAIVTFGSPMPGFQKLAAMLNIVPVSSYKNRFDPVTDVPVPFYPDKPYMHPRALLPLDIKPPLTDCSLFADHHIGLYMQGILGGLAQP